MRAGGCTCTPLPASTQPTWVLLAAPQNKPSSPLTFLSPEERRTEANAKVSLEREGPWGGWS